MAQHYYECTTEGPGRYGWKVYHYDESGNREIIVGQSSEHLPSKERAMLIRLTPNQEVR